MRVVVNVEHGRFAINHRRVLGIREEELVWRCQVSPSWFNSESQRCTHIPFQAESR